MRVDGTRLSRQEEAQLKQKYLQELNGKVGLPRDVESYPTQDMMLVICRNQGRHLLLRFRQDYQYCPGDWDFVTRHPHTEFSQEENAIEAVRHHVGLEGAVIQSFPSYLWLDVESRIWWHYAPFLMETASRSVQLRPEGKYSEFQWVDLEDIQHFSRVGYLENTIQKTIGQKD